MDEPECQVPLKPRQMPFHLGGVRVLLPVKPYPSQRAMMAQIITGLKHRQNCLLESPTGSGKSLALLCSSLAWQRVQTEKAQKYNRLVDTGITDPDILTAALGLPPVSARPIPDASLASSTPEPNSQTIASSGGFFYEDDDDFRSQPPPEMHGDASAVDYEMHFNGPVDQNMQERPKRLQVPKIFIGTRTHKQVEQLVKELRRTAYSDVRMTVLSSREHTCIHPVVSTAPNKNERCKELTTFDKDSHMGRACSYYNGANRIKMHTQLAQYGDLEGAWDIEDLIHVGHRINACPYYTARHLLGTSELVICPYNYLLDPLIRKSMQISLRNHVVILDEGHNIEDSARSAASCIVTQDQIVETFNQLREFPSDEHRQMATIMSALNGWIEENKDNLSDYTDYGSSGKIHTGTEIIAIFEDLGIRRDNFDGLVRCFQSVVDVEEKEDEKRLSSVPKTVLENLFLVLRFLFFENMKYKDDYRVALVKEMVKKKSGQKVDGWINRKSGMELEFSINFWCLNPAVAFSPISAVTHSIILTSGTLSPMSSFQSELGVAFKIHLEANHVIDKNQIFVGTVGQGPSGKPLLATYQHTSSWEFQDELGELVLNVCHTVPGGILCFLPSYAMLNKLLERWQNTGVWHEIGKVKEAMTEQKKGEDFERDMVHFYATIKNTQMEGAGVVGGVFFMAVFRGKVSEGLDFTDDNARAVISVGIPYPNVKNIQVDLKKKYNDSFQRSRKLLSGKEWYDIQAYRALNQALGRCIRHRYDWGALILVDMRFQRGSSAGGQQYNYYTRGLSKWVRNKVIHHRNFSTATKSLKEFVDNMMANPPKPPEMPSEVLPATSLESTSKEKIQSFASEKSDALHEVTDSIIQTTNTKVNSTLKSEMMSSQNISPCDRLQENIPEDQKECTSAAASSKDSPSNHDQSEPRHGSPSNESSKENDELLLPGRKRLLSAKDHEDLDDFNLALSPSILQAKQPPTLSRKRGRPKKGIFYTDIN